MRARGLKLKISFLFQDFILVAPHAGAWVETAFEDKLICYNKVAPHAGAWVETSGAQSPNQPEHVAPHAGAWVETWC